MIDALDAVDLRNLKNKRVLVTGASGFLGQHIVAAIHEANQKYKLGCRVVGVSRSGPSEFLKLLPPDKNITFKKINLVRPFHIAGTFDYIFHAAGYGQPAKFAADPFSTIGINTEATRELLAIAKRSKGTFVFFSSVEVYGDMSSHGPRAIYQNAKRLGE